MLYRVFPRKDGLAEVISVNLMSQAPPEDVGGRDVGYTGAARRVLWVGRHRGVEVEGRSVCCSSQSRRACQKIWERREGVSYWLGGARRQEGGGHCSDERRCFKQRPRLISGKKSGDRVCNVCSSLLPRD